MRSNVKCLPVGEGAQLQQYVNDRPYAANPFLSVAFGRLLWRWQQL